MKDQEMETREMELSSASSVTAYLGLGSNVGDRKANLERALEWLNATVGIRVVRSSSIYETEPWGLTDQPHFLNAAVEVETWLEPPDLLEAVKSIEIDMGRATTIRFGPRSIDIDILLYGGLVIDMQAPDLQIPHPRMSQRAFVLIPLAEVAGDKVHPTTQERIADMALDVEGGGGVAVLACPGQLQP